jgi:small subunit ribosomal protein S16
MSVAIRLQRQGTKKRPFYKVIITDSRKRRDGAFIEKIGHYNPLLEKADFDVDKERFDYWVSKGAQPSLTVSTLLKTITK